MGLIYKATLRSDGRCYIGQTINSLKARQIAHKSLAICGSDSFFHRAIRKHEYESFDWSIVAENLDDKALDEAEIEQISKFRSADPRFGFNLKLGGNKAGKPNELTKSKMSQAKKGKKLSAETRMKLSVAKIGNKNSLGYQHTDYSKELMSKSKRGEKNHFWGKKHSLETKALIALKASQKSKTYWDSISLEERSEMMRNRWKTRRNKC